MPHYYSNRQPPYPTKSNRLDTYHHHYHLNQSNSGSNSGSRFFRTDKASSPSYTGSTMPVTSKKGDKVTYTGMRPWTDSSHARSSLFTNSTVVQSKLHNYDSLLPPASSLIHDQRKPSIDHELSQNRDGSNYASIRERKRKLLVQQDWAGTGSSRYGHGYPSHDMAISPSTPNKRPKLTESVHFRSNNLFSTPHNRLIPLHGSVAAETGLPSRDDAFSSIISNHEFTNSIIEDYSEELRTLENSQCTQGEANLSFWQSNATSTVSPLKQTVHHMSDPAAKSPEQNLDAKPTESQWSARLSAHSDEISNALIERRNMLEVFLDTSRHDQIDEIKHPQTSQVVHQPMHCSETNSKREETLFNTGKILTTKRQSITTNKNSNDSPYQCQTVANIKLSPLAQLLGAEIKK